ncbi:MAG: RNA methyltransferase [Clostridia bacterium]|nr:RNA methyltransferase [Clostridia bacterium]
MKETITSRNNRLIVDVCKLRDKKYRSERGSFIIDGSKLFAESLKAGIEHEAVFMTEEYAGRHPEISRGALSDIVYTVSPGVMEKLSDDRTPDGILSAARFPKNVAADSDDFAGRCFILSGIGDPGNLGTMIRSAAALGVDTLILDSGCADVFNPKTVRASMGAIFYQSIIICNNLPKTVDILSQRGYKIYAAALRNSKPLSELAIDGHTVFAVGNEGHGLDEDFIDLCRGSVIIPISGKTESLNAAAAAAILMYEQGRNNGR